MSYSALFCTADVPPEAINQFIKESSRADQACRIFSLIRSPDQKTFDCPSKPRVKSFENGFLGAPFHTILAFMKSLENDESTSNLFDGPFAVLDERGLKDKTVVIWAWHWGFSKKYQEEDWEVIKDKGREYWTEFRTPWVYSGSVAGILSVRPQLYIDELEYQGDAAYFDEDCVFRVSWPLKDFEILSDSGESEEDDEYITKTVGRMKEAWESAE